jgi:sporulation protein YhbH
MAVLKPDYESISRGTTDAARHREKIKEAIQKNLPDIISDEAIITRSGDQLVRVPVRGIKSYRFIHRYAGGAQGGFGSGESEEGKVIGQRPRPGSGKPGKAGEQPGVDYLETEIEIAELIRMMLDDIGLPNLQRKEVMEAVVIRGWKRYSIEKHGIVPRLEKKRTIKEAIKRTEVLVQDLMLRSAMDEELCRLALDEANGDFDDALERLLSANNRPPAPGQTNFPDSGALRIENSDLRFRTIEEDAEYQSNAVVLAMMDVSGSMDTMKKYLARSFYFWMTSFLRVVYKRVEIRFIAHTTEARLVDEHQFLHQGESGGTSCHSAYDLATNLIDTEYPTSRWNVYPFHFSDGEDWDVNRTLNSLERMLSRGVANFGYGEIQSEHSSSVLMDAYRKKMGLEAGRLDSFSFYRGASGSSPVLGVVITGKSDIYPALRVFLHSPDRKGRD